MWLIFWWVSHAAVYYSVSDWYCTWNKEKIMCWPNNKYIFYWADVDSFKFYNSYAKDTKHVYWLDGKIKNIYDVWTFTWIDFYADKKYIYDANFNKVKVIDRKSFKYIWENFFKDKNSYRVLYSNWIDVNWVYKKLPLNIKTAKVIKPIDKIWDEVSWTTNVNENALTIMDKKYRCIAWSISKDLWCKKL